MATSRLNRPGERAGRRPGGADRSARTPQRSPRRSEEGELRHRDRPSEHESATQEARLAAGLGWFGIGLGVAELLVPKRLARTIGVPSRHHHLIQAMGIREIANGIGILLSPSAATAVWARVGGDMIDLACLGAAFTSRRSNRARLMTTAAAVAGATALDVLCAQQLTRSSRSRSTGREKSCTRPGATLRTFLDG
jgi:hypothetical protein